eukprot:Em0200g8a
MTRVSIVGTAGRGPDFAKMSKDIYRRTFQKAKDVITNVFKLELGAVELVSGGAAWSDHIAVQLFLLGDIGSLTLYLPCPWDDSKSQFLESGSKRSPGTISNTLHRMFSSVVKEDSLKQINDAIQVGAVTQVHNGFLKRNCSVAKSEYLVAFTWGKGSVPKEGGTLNTWMKCKGRKVHIPLDSLLSDGRKRQVPIDSLLSDVGTSVVEREHKRMKRCEEVKLQKPST